MDTNVSLRPDYGLSSYKATDSKGFTDRVFGDYSATRPADFFTTQKVEKTVSTKQGPHQFTNPYSRSPIEDVNTNKLLARDAIHLGGGLVEPSHPDLLKGRDDPNVFIDYRHYPPYEFSHPTRYPLNSHSFELKSEPLPPAGVGYKSLYRETRAEPGLNMDTGEWEHLTGRLRRREDQARVTPKEYYASYFGPDYVDYKHHLSRYPSMIDDVDFKTYYHRLYEDSRNFDQLKREDYSQTHRYPYTSAYLTVGRPDQDESSEARKIVDKRSVSATTNMRHQLSDTNVDYWQLMHEPHDYYHRLDPKYMLNWHSYNGYYPYMSRHVLDANRDNASTRGGLGTRPYGDTMKSGEYYDRLVQDIKNGKRTRQIDDNIENERLKREADLFIRDARLDDIFRRADGTGSRPSGAELRILGTPPLYLTPSKLYDNVDYRDLQRRNIDMLLRSRVVPVGVDITATDEVVYVLSELIRLESNWQDVRDRMFNSIDLDTDAFSVIVSEQKLDVDQLITLCQRVGVSPSERQLALFMKRFGVAGSITRDDLRRLFASEDSIGVRRAVDETTLAKALGSTLKVLLLTLSDEEKLHEKLHERQINIVEACKLLDKDKSVIDEPLLRDALLNRNVFVSSRDIGRFLRLVGEPVTFERLADYLKPTVIN